MNKIFLIFIVLTFSPNLFAGGDDFSWNVGFNNPYTSVVGGNILKLQGDWGFEAGLGYYDEPKRSVDKTDGMNFGAAFSAKRFFLHELFRPYAQAGLGLSSGSKGLGAGNGGNGVFIGAGMFVYGEAFYIYTSYNYSQKSTRGFFQFGIGFPMK